jgi:hypothetical protein
VGVHGYDCKAHSDISQNHAYLLTCVRIHTCIHANIFLHACMYIYSHTHKVPLLVALKHPVDLVAAAPEDEEELEELPVAAAEAGG